MPHGVLTAEKRETYSQGASAAWPLWGSRRGSLVPVTWAALSPDNSPARESHCGLSGRAAVPGPASCSWAVWGIVSVTKEMTVPGKSASLPAG